MTRANLIRLFSLAAIWGAAFLFLRIAVPALGALQTTVLRVLIGGLAMFLYAKAMKVECGWRKYWKHYIAIGAINSALPFSLFAYGAAHLPSSYEILLNSATPLFAAIFAALWMNEAMTLQKTLGLLIGAAGVALVAGIAPPGADMQFGICVAAGLLGAACYGISGIYIRKFTPGIAPAAMAGCSQLAAAALMSPVFLHMPPASALTLPVTASLLSLALLCSGAAYLLYFRLLAEAGPSRALTVTFLMPVFGMFWGTLFLHEAVTTSMLAGCGLIVSGTALVLGLVRWRKPVPGACK
jgi:drug/metabolite transporter (DMT)-like permease